MKSTIKTSVTLFLIVTTLLSVFSVFTVSAAAAPRLVFQTQVTTKRYSTIINLGSGKLLNVFGSKNINNANITVYCADRTSGQQFQFIKKGQSYMIIPKCAPTRAVNVYGSRSKANANVCIWNITANPTQLWSVEYSSTHRGYIIRSADNPNLVLTAAGNKNSSNVCLKKYDSSNQNQIWLSPLFQIIPNQNSSQSSFMNPSPSIVKHNYLQVKEEWSWKKTYNKSYLNNSGCGILSMVNAVYNLTGNFINPIELADWAYEETYFNQDPNGGGGISKRIVFSEFAKKFGSTYGFKYVGEGSNRYAYSSELREHIRNGGTAVVHVPGHFMCLVEYNEATGEYLVFDPAPNQGRRIGLTQAEGSWKTVKQLSSGSLKIDGYWLYKMSN